ncbi:F-box/LRR-repeat protein 16 isoform X1 [Sitodiplosis mosellana]|uniref:F-box/LRR-repeat protein 16 isoform X1 n=2 Tax=Sitodiplosis mosellana TaxID=263140 RepID=UPI002444F937|nr:F-box/LRR-repeat protein 16 isoform X1 [Sitodiplosis mosellana]XP_055320126.1 F-box/LRR-repeat protein 16 isoform X1 [Sitodiplosis mosellana]XP_055320127.1 F-box/LRR-repeat protein 16 isoform X1 [Sitodiplosis mosellana]XP_055320128.1 F-box/LRR-repeat protein 16 isoform X1 [Sitodiplosis mosellana]
MSSISAQGVVERASVELAKRINGLRSKHHHGHGKTSVMERVTNALCGGSSHNNASIGAPEKPEKPSRIASAKQIGQKLITSSGSNSQQGTPQSIRKLQTSTNAQNVNAMNMGGSGNDCVTQKKLNADLNSWNWIAKSNISTMEQLLQDERFLNKFFQYFTPYERRTLAQVCARWRDTLYRSPKFWSGILPTLQCRELRMMSNQDRVKLYNSLVRRGFHAICLLGATDEDAIDIVHSFPLASKHIHSLSLRCASVSDRGLEALLDHLQSLFELELAGCNEVTEAGLWSCLTPRIVSLSLADCINIADEAVGAVAQLLPSLYEFSLQAYHVTDAALGYFSPKQSHNLSILRLQSCWELTNHGIVNIVHSLPHLTVLSLSGCSKVTDDGIELIAENLQKLRALDLSWCPRITDASLEYIACDLNQLEELTLDRCVHITDIGVGYISTMLSLTALFLRWCSQVRDFGLQHLCSMRNLQVLSLAGCPLLTSSGLSSIIQLRHLQELELTNCPGASQELFEYLREHLPRCLIIE